MVLKRMLGGNAGRGCLRVTLWRWWGHLAGGMWVSGEGEEAPLGRRDKEGEWPADGKGKTGGGLGAVVGMQGLHWVTEEGK